MAAQLGTSNRGAEGPRISVGGTLNGSAASLSFKVLLRCCWRSHDALPFEVPGDKLLDQSEQYYTSLLSKK